MCAPRGERLDVQRLRVLPVDPVTNAAQQRDSRRCRRTRRLSGEEADHDLEYDRRVSANRRTALYAGVWFAITFAASIPAVLLYVPLLDHHDYILGAGADTRIAFGALLEVVLAIANVATAVVLFPILRADGPPVRAEAIPARSRG
jgi:hypothetical protein